MRKITLKMRIKKILSNGLNLLDLRTHTNSFVSITNLLKNYFEVTSWRDL